MSNEYLNSRRFKQTSTDIIDLYLKYLENKDSSTTHSDVIDLYLKRLEGGGFSTHKSGSLSDTTSPISNLHPDIIESYLRTLRGEDFIAHIGTQESELQLDLRDNLEKAKTGEPPKIKSGIKTLPRKAVTATFNALGWIGERLSRATLYPVFAALDKATRLEFKEIPTEVAKAFKGEAGDPVEVIYRSLSQVLPEKTAQKIAIPMGIAGSIVLDPLTYTGVGTVKKISDTAKLIKSLQPTFELYQKIKNAPKIVKELRDIQEAIKAGKEFKASPAIENIIKNMSKEDILKLDLSKGIMERADKFIKQTEQILQKAKKFLGDTEEDVRRTLKLLDDHKYFLAGAKKIHIGGIPIKNEWAQKIADFFSVRRIATALREKYPEKMANFFDKVGLFLPHEEKAVLDVFRNWSASIIHSRKKFVDEYIAGTKILSKVSKRTGIPLDELNATLKGFLHAQIATDWKIPYEEVFKIKGFDAKSKKAIGQLLDKLKEEDLIYKSWTRMGFLRSDGGEWLKLLTLDDLRNIWKEEGSLIQKAFGFKNEDEFITAVSKAIQNDNFLYLEMMRNGLNTTFKGRRQLVYELETLPFIAREAKEGYVPLKGTLLEGLYAPKEIAPYINRKFSQFLEPEWTLKVLDNFNNLFRKNVLGYFPSWAFRNFIGNAWNCLLEGLNFANPSHIKKYVIPASKIMKGSEGKVKLANGLEFTYKQLKDLFTERGILIPGLTTEVRTVETMREVLNHIKPSVLKKAWRTTFGGENPITWTIFGLNETIENLSRTALGLKTLIETGDIPTAVNTVNKVLFNYAVPAGSLDPIIRKYAIFWNWYRNNVIYQFSKIVEHPKIISGVFYPAKIGDVLQLNPDPELMPPHLLKQYYVGLSKSKGIVLENLLPLIDLNYFLEPIIPINRSVETGNPELDAVIKKYGLLKTNPLVLIRATEELSHPLLKLLTGMSGIDIYTGRQFYSPYSPKREKMMGMDISPKLWWILVNSPWSRLAYTTNLLLSKEARERVHISTLEALSRWVAPAKISIIDPITQKNILLNTANRISEELSLLAKRAYAEKNYEDYLIYKIEAQSITQSMDFWKKLLDAKVNIFAEPARILEEQMKQQQWERAKELWRTLKRRTTKKKKSP